jgi:hypothetical protein
MSAEPMTLDRLAMSLKGMPRSAVMMIQTDDGPVPIKGVQCGYGRTVGDRLQPLPSGASTSEGSPYLIILNP